MRQKLLLCILSVMSMSLSTLAQNHGSAAEKQQRKSVNIKTTDTVLHYRLSYPVGTLHWDGRIIRRLPEEKIDSELDMLKHCGITEVMLTGYTDIEPADFDMMKETERMGAKLRSRGMKASQHHGLAPSFAPLDQSQEDVVAGLIRQVRYTANLNADVLVLHAGRISGHHENVDSIIKGYERELKRHGMTRMIEVNAANLRRAGEVAQKLGVRIAMENLDRFEPLSDMELLPRLIKAVNSPAVGYCLDSGHAHCCSVSVTKWIPIMGDKLFSTHFHDNRGSRGKVPADNSFVSSYGIDEHHPPSFGTISWIDVIRELHATGYANTVNFESGPWPDMPKEEGYKAAIRFWRICEFYVNQKESGH